jgi:hypothetical protein
MSEEALAAREAELALEMFIVSEGDALIVDVGGSVVVKLLATDEIADETGEEELETALDRDELTTLLTTINEVGAPESVVLEVCNAELDILTEDDIVSHRPNSD